MMTVRLVKNQWRIGVRHLGFYNGAPMAHGGAQKVGRNRAGRHPASKRETITMTTSPKPLGRITTILRRRIDIAKRWHGLKTRQEVYDFVSRDPDVVALKADKQAQREMMMEVIVRILEYAEVDLSGCRKTFGREMVDHAILALQERSYLAESPRTTSPECSPARHQPAAASANEKREGWRLAKRKQRARESDGIKRASIYYSKVVIEALIAQGEDDAGM